MRKPEKKQVQHSDFRLNERPSSKSTHDDVRLAIDTIRPTNDMSRLSIELGQRVVTLTHADQSIRAAHHRRYRTMFDLPGSEPVIKDDGLGFAQQSLLDFDKRLILQDHLTAHPIWSSVGKGISAELGHVDQFGDWAVAHPLDEELRALPGSDALADAGFVFRDTYGTRENAKVSYDFKTVDNPAGAGRSLMGIRKRAAADLDTVRGDTYEIIKRSSFLVNVGALEDGQKPFLSDIMHNLKKDKYATEAEKQAAAQTRREAGQALIEPLLTDKARREQSQSILAVSTLYFALKRY